MIKVFFIFSPVLICTAAPAQSLQQFRMYDDVTITLDVNKDYSAARKTVIILYALPAGNTTEQTMGKKMNEGDDWHFDIQHIKAQTAFLRQEIKNDNVIVAYLDNSYKSWVIWKNKHPNYVTEVQHIFLEYNLLFLSQ